MRRHQPFIYFIAVALLTGRLPAEEDPAALRRDIEATRLEPERAVVVENLDLHIAPTAAGARFRIETGTLYPATPVGGRTVELVFLGRGRLEIEPPNAIEGGQLELFTGRPRLDEAVSEAVLVVTSDQAADTIARLPPAAEQGAAYAGLAARIFERWLERPERRLLGVEHAILRDAAGDPFYAGFFSGWFHSRELGEFLYLFEPDAREQMMLGQFTVPEEEKEVRRLERQLHRAQKEGRLMGLSVADLGQWDTWLSASLSDSDGKATPGVEPFEPRLYELDLSLGPKLEIEGRARLHLEALSDVGRAVKLEIHPDLEVSRVRRDGTSLYFHQEGREVLVILPAPPPRGETFVVTVEYAGQLLEKIDSKTHLLRSTLYWYPHTGSVDLAPYDVTFHWPDEFDLVTGGMLLAEGAEEGGRRYERRRLDHPTFGFSFEVGRFRTMTGQAGDIDVRVAFDDLSHEAFGKKDREEIFATVVESLVFFEEVFGPHPLDEVVVVTSPRRFSQGLFGFATLSTRQMTGTAEVVSLEDRRTVIAHEMAHQWWGHVVAWESYRDQWISEAMANYAAMLYARRRLADPGLVSPTADWQLALTGVTADGRTIEALGPLVLGERLDSSRGPATAYRSIVYKKGAVVLDMLSRGFGEARFLEALRKIVEAVAFRPISTAVFLDLLERLSQRDLGPFAEQFIYGTGLPEIYYDYEFVPAEDGGRWLVRGTARQVSPFRYFYRIVRRDDGSFDVEQNRLEQLEVADWSLLVPFQVAIRDPARERALLRGNLALTGATSDIRLELDYEPLDFRLDRDQQVFGRFFNERRNPKRVLLRRGLDAAAAGRQAAAEALYREALDAAIATDSAVSRAEEDYREIQRRLLDARIQLQIARLCLVEDRLDETEAALDEVRRQVLSLLRSHVDAELRALEGRLALRRGDPERAFRLLRRALKGEIDDPEALLVLAIAAHRTERGEELAAALEAARARGADASVLGVP